eukprot:SAG11_NODE_2066_length_3868_cov_10.653224_2_plen_47_part_00
MTGDVGTAVGNATGLLVRTGEQKENPGLVAAGATGARAAVTCAATN